ncbi:hypothetical protein D3C81_1287550 [compost metagenome]
MTFDADFLLALTVQVGDLQVLTHEAARPRRPFAIVDAIATQRVHQRQPDQDHRRVCTGRQIGQIARGRRPVGRLRVDHGAIRQACGKRTHRQSIHCQCLGIDDDAHDAPWFRGGDTRNLLAGVALP